ncbi:MAG: protein kinase [Thermoguttaceae bacterium]
MEDVQGYSLRDIMATYRRRHELPGFRLVLDWFDEACRELGELHAAGVVHRAICPANVLVGRDERIRIAAAAAAAFARPPDTTAGGAESEAAAYLAPEQRDGRSVDRRADIYSLGVTFYELLTLVYPVALVGSGIAPRGASAINATVPPAFDAILDPMLAPRPDDRVSSTGEILAAVGRLRLAPGGGLPPPAGLSPGRQGNGTMPAGRPVSATVPRLGLIIAGAVVGAAAGAGASFLLDIHVLTAAVVGSVVGAAVGCFVNPKV